MGESAIHRSLVEHMAEWVAAQFLGGDAAAILLDSSSGGHVGRPPTIGGHVPDLYVDDKALKLLVVGEAKTTRDLETERSERQIGTFLKYCAHHDNALFVLAVPWHKTRSARSLLRMLKRRLGLETAQTAVVEMLPG